MCPLAAGSEGGRTPRERGTDFLKEVKFAGSGAGGGTTAVSDSRFTKKGQFEVQKHQMCGPNSVFKVQPKQKLF